MGNLRVLKSQDCRQRFPELLDSLRYDYPKFMKKAPDLIDQGSTIANRTFSDTVYR